MHREKKKQKTKTTYYKTCTDIYVFQLIYKVIRRKKNKTKTQNKNNNNIKIKYKTRAWIYVK